MGVFYLNKILGNLLLKMENMDHEETPMEMEENKEEIQNKEENCGEEMMQDEDMNESELEEDEVQIVDNSLQTFEAHCGVSEEGQMNEVYTVSTHPFNTNLIASGGSDDQAYLWNLESMQVELHCTGHKDSVLYTMFNKDGKLLATVDMAGLVQVWKIETKKLVCQLDCELDADCELEWACWHPLANAILCGLKSGEVYLWKVPSGERKFFYSHNTACKAGVVHPQGRHAAFGYEDGSIRIYDLQSQQILHSFTKGRESHNKDVRMLIYDDENGTNLISASGDGSCKVINSNTGKIVQTYRVPRYHNQSDENIGAECVAVNTKLHLLVFGSEDGSVYVWNMKTNAKLQQINHAEMITKLLFVGESDKIVTATEGGTCRLINSRSAKVINTYTASDAVVFDISLDKEQKNLLVASGDGNVRSYLLEEEN